MEQIIAIAWEYRFVIVVVVATIVYGIFEWDKTKTIISDYMFKARALAREAVLESGQEQEDWVVEKAWDLIPISAKSVIGIFGGKEILRKIIKSLYLKLKDKLDNGVIDGSWIEKEAYGDVVDMPAEPVEVVEDEIIIEKVVEDSTEK